MSAQDSGDLSDFSLLEMFRLEVETQAAVMTEALLALERDPASTHHFEEVMRGAHSLKGAAAIVDRKPAVHVAHAMEDCFVAAQHGHLTLPQERIDLLLRGVDLLTRIATVPEPWKPHRQHVYQRAVLSGFSVPQVVLRVGVLNMVLIPHFE